MIGSHGHEHIPLGSLHASQQHYQVQRTKDILGRIAEKPLRAFSYPYGSEEACKGMDKVLVSEDFTFAFTMKRKVNHNLEVPFYLSRFDNNDLPGGKANKIPSDVNLFDFFNISKL